MPTLMPIAKKLSLKTRRKRFELFERLASSLPRPLQILDVGGTVAFWESMGWAGRDDTEIVCINLRAGESPHANIRVLAGDATNLSAYEDGSFDIVFSNSVIEHLFTCENQESMAAEVRRVGKAFWVQTPNYWFPLEPHFHFVGWQWLPESVRVAILRRRTCGYHAKTPEKEHATRLVREVRLMSRRDLRRMFPGARIVPERMLGLVKSWVAVDGFPVA